MKYIVGSKPFFSVDEEGSIYWNETGRKLKPYKDKDGYYRICYRVAGKNYHIAPHRAVAEVFVQNPRLGEYKVVNHKNGIKTDNSPDNLQWTSVGGNRQHAQFTGAHNVQGTSHSQCKTDETTIHKICEMLELGYRVIDISKKLKIKRHQVTSIKRGTSWRSISSLYKIELPRKELISESTMIWLKTQISDGLSPEEIIGMSTRFNKQDTLRIKKLLDFWKCND